MEQSLVIRKLITTIKISGEIPKSLLPSIRDYLMQSYAAGYDHRGKELVAHNKKRVLQINEEGKIVGDFESVNKAAKLTGYRPTAIYSAIERKSISKKNRCIWQYYAPEKLINQ